MTLAYVRACGGDVTEWESAWHGLAAELAADVAGSGAQETTEDGPYVGLGAFRAEDACRFFGRTRVLDDLDVKLTQHRFLAVFGPSGAGKSSLLRAGFAARRADSTILFFTPGPCAFEECALHLARILGSPASQVLDELKSAPGNLKLLLRQAAHDRTPIVVVDQFEELFTLCAAPAERAAFLDALLAASDAAEVVIGVRADFYPRCAEHPALAEAISETHLLLGPMTAPELRDVIVRPAAMARLSVEGALVNELVAEAHDKPAVLPLLSHALRETWHRRRGTTLTLSGYHATGGIRGALANTAESEYTSLDAGQQLIARNLFLRLIDPGGYADDTSRRLKRDELDTDAPGVNAVLERLAAARLITLDVATVELAHEALIRHWPRLRDWVAEDREGLRVHRRLTRAAEEWESLDRDPGILYRGARLDSALTWRAEKAPALNTVESAFLHAATALREQQSQLERQRARRHRRVVTLLSVLFLFVAAAIAYGVSEQQQAAQQAALALSQRMVSQGRGFLPTDASEAARLGLAAYQVAPTDEARDLVLSADAMPNRIDFSGNIEAVQAVALTSDGRLIALADANVVQLWDLPHYRKLATITGSLGERAAISLSADGRWLTLSRPHSVVDLFDLSDPTAPALKATITDASSASVDPSGTVVAVWGFGQASHLLAIDRNSGVRTLAELPTTNSLSFSSDGHTAFAYQDEWPTESIQVWQYSSKHSTARKIATWTGVGNVVLSSTHGITATTDTRGDEKLRLWDTSNLAKPRELPPPPLPPSSFQNALFTSDTRTLAVTDQSATIRAIDLSDRQHPRVEATLTGHTSLIRAMSYLPDGRLLSAGLDGAARPWDLNLDAATGHLHP
ncbi:nSTAND1 domain-containing NTPase [Amycolatopsis dendrobii]|uniref:AAA family ATPase n=1 Tax=Amycolatopsis dendrobii TaxID=2760662 RepID=A0A7W3VRU5_9PSEU|nr:AAA family ATPase [Amycolatopsis dendrobii]MBB1152034.1 AAA family ATPase [Amycolatopsis dendrobii]